jgi:hypothetical protein
VNVLPATLNVEDTGTVAIEIFGADGAPVSEIDLGSIRLSGGVAPQAVSSNGTSVLAGFAAADVIASLRATLGRAPYNGEVVSIELTGSLLDDTLIHGSDTIQIQVFN